MRHLNTAILASMVLGLMLFVAMPPAGPQEKKPVVTNHRPVEIPNVFLAVGNQELKPVARNAHPGSPSGLGQELADPEAAPPMVNPAPVPQPSAPMEPGGTDVQETPAEPANPVQVNPSFGPAPAAPVPAWAPPQRPMAEVPRPTGRLEWIEPPTFRWFPDPMAGNSPLLVMVGLMSMGMVLAVKTVRMP